jgi:hypothetical protein
MSALVFFIQQIWANIPEHIVLAALDAFDKPNGNLLNKMIFF